MTSRTDKKTACSAPRKPRNRPYDNRPGPGPARAVRRPSPETPIRVDLPGEPPRLTPGAARALLRILLKAHAQLDSTDHPQGAAE